MNDTELIDPWELTPLHPARSGALLDELIESMESGGWDGRPLLVIETPDAYQAWTGSHRIAAAREARVPTVPCIVIDGGEFERAGLDADAGHVDDTDRQSMLRQIGRGDAAAFVELDGHE